MAGRRRGNASMSLLQTSVAHGLSSVCDCCQLGQGGRTKESIGNHRDHFQILETVSFFSIFIFSMFVSKNSQRTQFCGSLAK